MKRFASILAVVAVFPTAALAQQATSPSDNAGVGVGALRSNWRSVTDNIVKAADELSVTDYAYRPVETVRTFGQLVAHVASSQFLICAAALGDPLPAEDAVEKSATTKAALVKAFKESTDYCARAYAQTDANAAAATKVFDQTMPRFGALALNAVHNGEHYGNIVTYLRMKGMVPPSSRR